MCLPPVAAPRGESKRWQKKCKSTVRQAMEAEWQGHGQGRQQQQQLLLRERPYERGRGNDPAEGSSSMVDAHMVASAAGGEKSMSISAMVEQREGDLAAIAVLHRSRVENGVGQSEAAVSMDDAGAVQRGIVDEGLCGLGLSRNGVRGEFGAIVSQPDDLAEEMSSLASQRPALHHDFSDMASQQVEDGYGSMAKQRGLVEDEAGAIAAHRAKEARVYRKGFWSMNETMVLLSLKRQDNEKQARGNERERNRTSAERWREIEEGCWARGVKKSSQQIKDKWDHLSADFKKVMDYENSVPVGQKSYWQMTTDERREIKNMPLHFHLQVYQYMNQWMRKSKPIRRTVAVDSLQHPVSEIDSMSRKKRRLSAGDDIDLRDCSAHVLEKMGQSMEHVLRESCQLQIDSQKKISQAHIEIQKQISQSQIDAQKQIAQMQIDMQKQLIELQMQQGKEFIAAMYAMVNVLGELGRALNS